jgi:hypothetical protein
MTPFFGTFLNAAFSLDFFSPFPTVISKFLESLGSGEEYFANHGNNITCYTFTPSRFVRDIKALYISTHKGSIKYKLSSAKYWIAFAIIQSAEAVDQ